MTSAPAATRDVNPEGIAIHVVHCRADVERAKAVGAGFAAQGLDFTLIEAIDAREGLDQLTPYRALIGDTFWNEKQIKPGAVACFLSHRLAWQALVSSGRKAALIMEDDSLPNDQFASSVRAAGALIKDGADIVFVNDRLAEWSTTAGQRGHASVQDVMMAMARADIRPEEHGLSRAPGGDGYLLTSEAAGKLLEASAQDQIRCGVDWYMIAMGLDIKKIRNAAKGGPDELRKLRAIFGIRPPKLSVAMVAEPGVVNNRSFSSSIVHKRKVTAAKILGQ